MKRHFLIKTNADAPYFVREFESLIFDGPHEVIVQPFQKRRTATRNDMLNAHLRDIAHHRHGEKFTERRFEEVVADFKRTDIWPRESDPSPDAFTGEVLYRPKSRGDLTQAEAVGITAWLQHYMDANDIPSRQPLDNWQEET